LDKYEYKVRSEEISKLIEKEKYTEAVKIADTIDWRRVKSVTMLLKIAALYRVSRRNDDSREMLLLAYDRYPTNRSVVHSLCELSIEMDDVVSAIEYFKQFVKLAPKDSAVFTLRYRILEAQEVSLEERIEILEELKKKDYQEEWAYELAYLYHRVGLATKCVEECDDIILWFGDGPYVMKAMELKAMHVPLTAIQQKNYDIMLGNAAENYSGEASNDNIVSFNAGTEEYDTDVYSQEGYTDETYTESGYEQNSYGQDEYADGSYEQSEYDGSEYEAAQYPGNDYGQSGYDAEPYAESTYGQDGYAGVPYADNGGYEQNAYDSQPYAEQSGYEGDEYGNASYADSQYEQNGYDGAAYPDNSYSETDYTNEPYADNQYGQADYTNEPYADNGYDPNHYVDDGYGNLSYNEGTYQDNGYTGAFYVEQIYDENGNLVNPDNEAEQNYPQTQEQAPSGQYRNGLHLVENKQAASGAPGDMSQYNTINLQKVVAESMKELFPDDDEDVFAEDREKYNSGEDIKSITERNTRVFANIANAQAQRKKTADPPADEQETDDEQGSYHSYTQTGRIAQMVTGVSETAPEPHTGAIKKVYVPGQDARLIKSDADMNELRDITEKSVNDEQNWIESNEENVYHEQNIMEMSGADEAPKTRTTGPMKIDDVLVEWERMKLDNAKKHQEEIKQHVLSQTGKIFDHFDNSIKSGILGELEREEEEARRSSQAEKQSRKERAARKQFLEADVTGDIPQRTASEDEFDVEYVTEHTAREAAAAVSEEPVKTEKSEAELREAYLDMLERVISRELGKETAGEEAQDASDGEDKTYEAYGQEEQTETTAYSGSEYETGAYEPEQDGEGGMYEPEQSPENVVYNSGEYESEWGSETQGYEAEEYALSGDTAETAYGEGGLQDESEPYTENTEYEPADLAETESYESDGYTPEDYTETYDSGDYTQEMPAADTDYTSQEIPAADTDYTSQEIPAADTGYISQEIPAADTDYISQEIPAADTDYTSQDYTQELYAEEPEYIESTPQNDTQKSYEEEYAGYAENYSEQKPYAEESASNVQNDSHTHKKHSRRREDTGLLRREQYQYNEKALDPEDAQSIAEMAMEDALKTQEIKMNTADLSSLSEKIVATAKKEAKGAKREELREFTPEEQTLFENFAVTKKIKKQIIHALENMTLTAYTGNVIITGDAGLDTVRMAKNLVKEYQASDGSFSGKLAKITGEKINQRNIKDVFEKLNNGGIIIEKANGMSEEKLYEMALNLNQENLGIVVIMEDTKKEITKLLEKQAMIADYFNIRIDLMEMDNNALVAYAKNYALALEYSIDELGTLALYTRIANMQSGNHVVTKDEVRDIIDEAIWKSKKSKIKNFVDVLFARRYDNEDMIVLKERDFM